ncbi:lipoyl synthase [bacterium endosymbiont of Bathymodiolus sp. 5 South]|jgi:lipoic acid synthetase|uniref:lipoyl synthase n=1 Tax=bacterium endosymbiont of Bathymodiolus sp. 5 South TaxID=1181670 RepID=UPI0010B2C845|nr:lipoyl synthase [bacterium endosymbiont of Bathymodiolus sp. 5 South]CAC9460549.1 Lipoyl synthase (EC 2.8.1.8) [uncultured Gammaproteobacteria bacterium]CAC9653849.1 Lipoyl synthase (EC 2.8.1.8) [uncultured Gammaproteobacteria bacterium]CAC9660293.1 Lipoyl synthase (EC 2.8.1.8) [uncultured Gammaproteobacteria bacterium]SHN91531.1 Lipoyl synthase [bacterium endosymbiont of Bathymodiolus sp. 5 South]SSC08471.1 Lipoate synthase [bacterium endosymbiont of Bathymodiolus sp. 5 South]
MSQEVEIRALKGKSKVSRLKIKPDAKHLPLRKPQWIRIKHLSGSKVDKLKNTLREQKLFTVCEEAQCPNLGECFNHGTATFMIMGQICTRRCPFCDVAHGKPKPLDVNEPQHLAQTIEKMQLKYVVITSVDRDDLRDGGAEHFKQCINQIRQTTPQVKIEVLTPDFRGRMEKALEVFATCPPDVFNHNLETVPSLYPKVRPGADYAYSLKLLKSFKQQHPNVTTKSGIMLGVGETKQQILDVLSDLRSHDVEMLTLGQYLQPSKYHLAVEEYITPEQFEKYRVIATQMGFSQVASGPMVRSSYHADLQASGELIT